jgi:hypothetical protein
MKGIEMMIANLLGMKPEEMRLKVEQAVSLMEHGAKAMNTIQTDLNLIKNHLGIEEVKDNGGRALAERGNNSPANGHRIEL